MATAVRTRRGARPARPRRALIVAAIACGALACGVLAAPAAAFHIPGAFYSGNVAGGGTISFGVSGDGSAVTNLSLGGPIGRPDCQTGSRQYSQAIPITKNSFSNGEVAGSFPNVQGAHGSLNIVVFVLGIPSSCRITNTWSAITTASPYGSKECKKARHRAKKRKKALIRAERRGSAAQVKKARRKWKKARSRRDRYC